MSEQNHTTQTTTQSGEVVNGFQIPKWAGKPPSGLHLDVMKEGKMIQKLMIDEKNYYFFGRNKDVCDFVIDHASCSRVHAVLLWHKHLNRSFLIDLGSTHGTFIGSIRLELKKPQQVFVDSELKFGASTRTYIIRERPQINKNFPSILSNSEEAKTADKEDTNVICLPESEIELDNLTEFNTAHNKRIAQLIDIGTTNSGSAALVGPSVKRKKKSVTFNDEEDIINPEDIDPTVGRFRNMVQTSFVIPKKRPSNQMIYQSGLQPSEKRPRANHIELSHMHSSDVHLNEIQTLYDEYEETYSSSSLSIKTLDLAPDVDNPHGSQSNENQKVLISENERIHILNRHYQPVDTEDTSPSFKKKYAKEAWPGRKPHSTTNSPNEPASSHQYQQHQNYEANNSPKNSSTTNAPKRLMI